MDHVSHRTRTAEPGLIASITGLARNAYSLLTNRVQLALVELQIVGVNMGKLVAAGIVAAVCAWFAIAYWSVMVVALAWDALGWKILLIMALLFSALVVGLAMYARSLLRSGKQSIHQTMAELRNDRDALL